MNQTRNPRTEHQAIGSRLIFQEIDRVRKGLSRYSRRAAALARDLEPKRGSNFTILHLERRVHDVLSRLEERLGHE